MHSCTHTHLAWLILLTVPTAPALGTLQLPPGPIPREYSLLETVFSAQSYLPLTFPLSRCTESRTVRFMLAFQECERGRKQRQGLRRGRPRAHPHRCPPETKGLTHMDKNLLPCCGTRRTPHIPLGLAVSSPVYNNNTIVSTSF